jgi:hypothetical protein
MRRPPGAQSRRARRQSASDLAQNALNDGGADLGRKPFVQFGRKHSVWRNQLADVMGLHLAVEPFDELRGRHRVKLDAVRL